MKKRELLIILGPTGVGKSDYAVETALKYGSPVISCDSRQIYSELDIGVARPSREQLDAVEHYFIASHHVTELYSAGDYEREALPLLESLFENHEVLVMAGGSGMYIDAVCRGLDDFPEVDMALRDSLVKQVGEEGVGPLAARLKELDPETYAAIDTANHKRVVRALEVVLSTGRKFSSFKKNSPKKRPFSIRKTGIIRDRDELYGRINARVDTMVASGLVEEAERVLCFRNRPALNTVGYKEIFDAFDGKYTLEKAVELIKRNTRHYAKKQMTYWRRDPEIEWLDFSS